MMRWPRARWAVPLLVFVVDAGLVFGALGFGLRVRPFRVLPAYPEAASLDYSAATGVFSPLRSEFIAEVLGRVVPDGASGGDSAGLSPTRTTEVGQVVLHPFTNDDFEDAKRVERLPFTAKTDTSDATQEQGEPRACAPVGGSVWYRFRPKRDLGLSANTFGTTYATVLGVFRGSRLNELRSVGCDTSPEGNAVAGFAAKAGTTYYFQITGPVRGGDLVFNLGLQGITTRASSSSSGEQGNNDAVSPAISADGRYVAFASDASNLVAGDTNAIEDIFVRDRATGATTRASVSSAGEQANLPSWGAAISADGRYVAYASEATNLAPESITCTDGARTLYFPYLACNQVFLHDLLTGATSQVSVSSQGLPANGSSFNPALSASGRYVAFESPASNLVPRDMNGFTDVFVHDRVTGATTRVSMTARGEETRCDSYRPSISADGRHVAFHSCAQIAPRDENGIADVFLHDRATRTTMIVSATSAGRSGEGASNWAQLSADGRYVAFTSSASDLVPGDTNGVEDVFLWDRLGDTTTRMSVSSSGKQGDDTSVGFSISADGRYVTFDSEATNLVPGRSVCTASPTRGLAYYYLLDPCRHVFLHDRVTGETIQLDISTSGRRANEASSGPSLSWDGRFVAFDSDATNLVEPDTNTGAQGGSDVFVRELAGIP